MGAGLDAFAAPDARVVTDFDDIAGGVVAELHGAGRDAGMAVDALGFIEIDERF